jgi:hypothetical protein
MEYDFNPEFHTKHWRVLERLPELKGQRLTLIIEWDSYKVIKETGYKIFTGVT